MEQALKSNKPRAFQVMQQFNMLNKDTNVLLYKINQRLSRAQYVDKNYQNRNDKQFDYNIFNQNIMTE